MKIIVTEQQIKQLALTERVGFVLSETLNESKNIDSLKEKIKKLILNGVAITAIVSGINQLHISYSDKIALMQEINKEKMEAKAKQDAFNGSRGDARENSSGK